MIKSAVLAKATLALFHRALKSLPTTYLFEKLKTRGIICWKSAREIYEKSAVDSNVFFFIRLRSSLAEDILMKSIMWQQKMASFLPCKGFPEGERKRKLLLPNKLYSYSTASSRTRQTGSWILQPGALLTYLRTKVLTSGLETTGEMTTRNVTWNTIHISGNSGIGGQLVKMSHCLPMCWIINAALWRVQNGIFFSPLFCAPFSRPFCSRLFL